MDITELIRNANSAPEVLSALSVYIESLRHASVIPDWCLQLPLEGEADVKQRMLALVTVVNLTSQNLRDRDCNIAKQALQVFAAATWRLRPRSRKGLKSAP
ncbi:MAG TPA: hypothetical protein VMJ14_12250 [Burkholderiales bacterium]|nr:hypothetical protein [Burkholderiales bacterium]